MLITVPNITKFGAVSDLSFAQKQPFADIIQNNLSKKLYKIHRETPTRRCFFSNAIDIFFRAVILQSKCISVSRSPFVFIFSNNTASVFMAGSWYNIDPEDHINAYLSQAVAEGTVLNITFNAGFLPLSPIESNLLNQNRLYEIGIFLLTY